MTTLTSRPMPSAGVDWYVRKHRRESEDTGWDESRVQSYLPKSAGATTTGVLVRFFALALGLTAALGVIAAAIR